MNKTDLKKLKRLVGKIVEVYWVDIFSLRDVPLQNIRCFEGKKSMYLCQDFGKVLKVSEDFLIIGYSIGQGIADITSFPLCVLIEVNEIKSRKNKRR